MTFTIFGMMKTMNIFILDEDPSIAARMMCDKHVVKMIVESGQMLSTVWRVLDGEEYTELSKSNRKIKRWKLPWKMWDEMLYKASFVGHPCTQWAMENDKNFHWLTQHAYELCSEYTRRYKKTHKASDMISYMRYRTPENIRRADKMTDFAQAMPDQYKEANAVNAYRNYYIYEKCRFAKWKDSNVPDWYTEGLNQKKISEKALTPKMTVV